MPNENKCCSKCFREGEVVITCGCPCHDNASGSIGIGGDKAFGASRGSSSTKTTEEMEENLSTPEKIANQETQRVEETSKGLNELRNQIPVEERGGGKAKIPPTLPSWEEEFEKFYPDYGADIIAKAKTATEIGIAEIEQDRRNRFKSFIRSLLSSHIPLEEVVGEAKEVFKKYWYQYGRWHNAGCHFILSDQGVCNCRSGKIRQEISSSLKQKLEERRTNQK